MAISKIRVLLVDDHAVVRDGMRLMLGTVDDIEVAGEAGNAQEAMRLVQQQSFDVALVDIALPGRNGLELLKLLRAAQPKLAILMFSMYAEEIYAVRALKYGAAGYLTKNSPITAVVAAIHKAAQGGKYVSPALSEKLAGMIGSKSVMSHEVLSDRELEVLKLLAAGESLVRIAESLHLSASTVTTYRGRILEKMGLKNDAELVRYALENGLLI